MTKERRDFRKMIKSAKPRPSHVIIGGVVFKWEDKAPYVASGRSVLGALEYNQEFDVIKCHVCGEWHQEIGKHTRQTDGMEAKEYRKTYGLNQSSSLSVPSVQENMRRHAINRGLAQTYGFKKGKPGPSKHTRNIIRQARPKINAETRNLRSLCQAQIRARVRELALSLGHTPTIRELESNGITGHVIRDTYQVSVNGFMRSLGLTPNTRKGPSVVPGHFVLKP